MTDKMINFDLLTAGKSKETQSIANNDYTLKTNLKIKDDIEGLVYHNKAEDVWKDTVYAGTYFDLHCDELKTLDKFVFYSKDKKLLECNLILESDVFSRFEYRKITDLKVGSCKQEDGYFKIELIPSEFKLVGNNYRIVFGETMQICLLKVEWIGQTLSHLDNILRLCKLSNDSLTLDKTDLQDGYMFSESELDFSKSVDVNFGKSVVDIDQIIYIFKNNNEICEYKIIDVQQKNISGFYTLKKPPQWNSKVSLVQIYIKGNVVSQNINNGITKNIITPVGSNQVKITFAEDKTGYIKNPSMGWMIYIEDCYANPNADRGIEISQGMTTEEYWAKIDELTANTITPSILYIRLGWSWFEPEEGKYAWNDPSSDIYKLIAGAKQRGLQLAFRVLIDSTDNSQQSIPQWVYDRGLPMDHLTRRHDAETNQSVIDVRDACVDHPVFLEWFEKFIKAFAEKFDKDPVVSHIDAQGMGDWGEVNGVCALDPEPAVQNIMNLYKKYFKNVLLGFQIYSSCGSNYGLSQHFVMRRDGLGSPVWYGDDQKEGIISNFYENRNVLYGESCYHGLRYENGDAADWAQINHIVGWSLERVLKYVLEDALVSRANTLDLRMYSDMECWMKAYPEGIQRFICEGGYRLFPVQVVTQSRAKAGQYITIYHEWKNRGVGRLPNHNHQWKGKYKLVFALLGDEGKVINKVRVDDANPGDWIRESENKYITRFKIPVGVKDGYIRLQRQF